MEYKVVVTENWFTKKPNRYALLSTLLLGVLLYAASFMNWSGIAGADQWMSASGKLVFGEHEYWRAWTTLLVHGDLSHLLANSFLFFLFSYTLMSYFSSLFFPLMGFFMGGVANLIVLLTMPEEVHLIGASGVVHWMGAAWAMMYLLVERRQKFRPRFGSALFLMLVLFTPDTYKPNVSYMAHFVGFVLGIGSAWGYYRLNRSQFQAAEVSEIVMIPEWEFGPWDGRTEEDDQVLSG